ncbi:COR domain-containing protein [Peribacillus sp. YIM B13477]|uniref:COR domain-containing protein n=1 Tax=Peribacillus sp. YIM B13477 TaxID=3366300 RepID=UPI00366BFD24
METQLLDNDLIQLISHTKFKKPIRPINKILTNDVLQSIIEKAETESWEILNLTGTGLKELPKEIGKLKSLKRLYLGNVHLMRNSTSIYKNNIERLPDEFFELKNLEFLDLYYLNIKELSSKITNLCNLNGLFLTGNEFKVFPTHIFDLRNLTKLALPSNFKEIPAGIDKLVNLDFLNIIETEITHLPEEIGNLIKLTVLRLDNSKIKTLPRSIRNLSNLKLLGLDNTYFQTFIAPEILAQTPQETINYIIRYQEDQSKVTLNESKMLIVGQGGVGKSTLLNRLVYDNFAEPGTLESTEGIDIEKWLFDKDSNNYTLNVWDFGGQEIYHSTHQFFLTNRSLYVLVWDARQEDEYGRIDYWLNTIESFAGDSPILLVINKCDERKIIKDIDLKSLRRNFQQIIEVYKVSCQNGMGIADLRDVIQEETKHLPLMGLVWLSSWIQIRTYLEELSKSVNLIPYSEYLEICERYGVPESEAKSLSKYLHDLGIILHFHEDIILKNTVILSPDWGTTAVYKVLDTEDDILKNRNGTLYYEDLQNIWVDKENYSEDKYLLILRLMENFQLSFEVEKNKVFLIPEFMGNLEFEINDIEFKLDNTLTFQYNYDFLPAGIMTRFIVKAHNFLIEYNNKKACWKKGAFLKYKDAVARVRLLESLTNKRIEISVTGNSLRNKQELLKQIRLYFDQIHESMKKLKVTEFIKCNCSSECMQLHDYNLLLRYEQNSRKHIVCNTSLKDVDVSSLLDGIASIEQRTKKVDEFMDYPHSVIVNVPITNTTNNNNNNNNENVNVNKNTIDIKYTIYELQGAVNDLRDEVQSKAPELGEELDKLEKGVNKLITAKSKEEIIQSGFLRKFNRFMDEVENPDTLLGKTVKNIKGGISITQDIADQYNKIAQWFGLPVVPKPFLKNK